MPPGLVVADSVTQLGDDAAGQVVVAGSHAGVIAAQWAASAGAHALVLNDGGIGCDAAGIAGLAWLETFGIAAAAIDCRSARIGDGADMLARGRIRHVNAGAARAGVRPGQDCRYAAELLLRTLAAAGRSARAVSGAGFSALT